jgi:diaminohydroxyphosphoribosylaminopyrimidine deaminase / 5-amino-6-(5-phosphoribosylamino)uracil reductase
MSMDQDIRLMRRALALAERGRVGTSPNPMVGCVLARNGRILSEGWHRRFGGPHAEIEALRRAGRRAAGATCYVTLEPCSHWGKTGPCVDALIRAGVRRVVAAMSDPYPPVRGRGFRRLRQARVQTLAGLLHREARALNRAYIYGQATGLPYVVYKCAQTLDGKIASRTGRSRWITGEEARQLGHRLRAEADAVLVGANTVRQDDPWLTSHGQGSDPLRLILSASLDLPLTRRIFDRRAPTWVLTADRAPLNRQRALERAGVQVLRFPAKQARLDLLLVMKDLFKMGITKVLCEGGGDLGSSLLAPGLIREVYLFAAPRFLGGRSAPTSLEGPGWTRPQAGPSLVQPEVSRVGGDFLIHGYLN